VTIAEAMHGAWEHFDRIPGWGFAVTGGAIAAPALVTPIGETLSFNTVVHAIGVVVGVLSVLWPLVRKLIKDSDRKTERVVAAQGEAITVELANRLTREMAQLRRENAEAARQSATVTPRLVSIDATLRDVGDVRGELQGMAYQVGELANRTTRNERDISALHTWKREHLEQHKKGDELLKQWAVEFKRLQGSEDTPPSGWDLKKEKP